MLMHLILKEIKEMLSSKKFILTFIVCSVLIIMTFYSGAEDYKLDRALYETVVQENLQSMEGITDWRMIEHTIYLPPQPLESLVAGIGNDIGRDIEMYGRGELTSENSKFGQNPVYAVFRFLDLNFLFQVILSLFAILFAYDAISGEKEKGTLRLTFSNAVPRHTYILGKILGSFLALAIPLLVVILLGCLLLPALGVPMNSEDWLKLSLIIAAGFLFFGFMLALSLFVSSLTRHSSNSFLILLTAWILIVLILPRSSILLAGRAVDVPNVDEINNLKNSYSRELSEELFTGLENFQSSTPGDMQVSMNEFQQYMEKLNKERDEKMKIFSDRLNEKRLNAQIERERIALSIAHLSPSALFSMTASELAGTSLGLQRSYEKQAAEYQKLFAAFQKEKTGESTGGGLRLIISNDGDDVTAINPQELPVFSYEPPSTASVLPGTVINFGILMLCVLLSYAASFIAFKKYDLR